MNPGQDRPWRFSALPERPPSRWPGGQRLALWVALGVEDYRLEGGMAECVMPGVPSPDLVNAAWRDYGNRVGAFRLLDMLRAARMPVGLLLNTDLYHSVPAVIDAARLAGCEIIAHGRTNSDTLAGLSADEERAYLRSVHEAIERAEGRPPSGWSSPWLAQNATTLDNLAAVGFRYLLDWRLDDQPVWLETGNGPLLAIPYATELNDSTTAIGRLAPAPVFAEMIIDELDQMLGEPREQAVVMSLVLHSYISGQPFRARALQRVLDHIEWRRDAIWLTTPRAIHQAVLRDPALSVGPSRDLADR